MHENKHSCLEHRLPGFTQMLHLGDPLMFCKWRCCRAKHFKLGRRTTREYTGDDVNKIFWTWCGGGEQKKTKGSFNMADVVTVAVEGQLVSRRC